MSEWAIVVLMIFCTPLGWLGLLMLGLAISIGADALRGRRQ